MKIRLGAAVSALALSAVAAPVSGQSMNMPGMSMPAPKPTLSKQTAHKKTSSKAPVERASEPALNPARSPTELDHDAMEHGATGSMPPPTEKSAAPTQRSGPAVMPMPMAGMGNAGHSTMVMTGAFGPYAMERESSGTAWQPDVSEHSGLMTSSGDWMLMAHGVLNLAHDHQSGPRGDNKVFASGMLMGMARRPLGNGVVQFKAMVSPDPLMGKSGYPLLLASGETANGRDRLIDRQHPHDFLMELSTSVAQNIGPKSSVFIYGGLPGEPAFGPPAFMHREAILDSPEAPISHHWLDSTHISFGVVTAGIVLDRVKIEISRFNGREPDQHRWNIETGPLDSTAVRLSWNPTATLSFQGSWGQFRDPEQLEPEVDQRRWSASLLYAREFAPGWKLAGTIAWGRKTVEHHDDDALVTEASLKHAGWTVFGRGEMTENRELLDVDEHGTAYRVGKVSMGLVRDFRVARHMSVGAGGLASVNFLPKSLSAVYGSRHPAGTMAFVRLRLID